MDNCSRLFKYVFVAVRSFPSSAQNFKYLTKSVEGIGCPQVYLQCKKAKETISTVLSGCAYCQIYGYGNEKYFNI